jgi:hypothetical protein
MRYEVVNGAVTFLAHPDIRQVSETQVARSPHLARLRLLPGVAELPIRPDAFLAWQDFVEEVCDAEDLSLETACEVFEARFLRIGMCWDNLIAMIQAEYVQTPETRTACIMHLCGKLARAHDTIATSKLQCWLIHVPLSTIWGATSLGKN